MSNLPVVNKNEITSLTKQELLALLQRKPWDETREYDWVAFTPSEDVHDSGYNCFIVIGGYNSDKAPEILTTSADHLWVESITAQYPIMARISFDCFGEWVRMFSHSYVINAGADLSSYELTWSPKIPR